MRIKQHFAVLIYLHGLYNYILIGLGVFWPFLPFGCAGVCLWGMFWQSWLCSVIWGN